MTTTSNLYTVLTSATPAGTNVIGYVSNDPCSQQTKLGAVINTTGSLQIIAGTWAKKTYICAIDVVVSVAQNVALVEGTGTACATNIFGLAGGTTAATGWNFSANSGIARGAGNGTVYSPSADLMAQPPIYACYQVARPNYQVKLATCSSESCHEADYHSAILHGVRNLCKRRIPFLGWRHGNVGHVNDNPLVGINGCGAGGASVLGTSDTVTLDASSGAGTVTLAATITNIQSLTMTAFTGTVDMSVNNPSFTCTQLTSASAGGSPIIKLTSGTITVTGPNGIDLKGANASSVLNSGTIALTQTALSAGNNQPFTATGKTYGNLTIGTHTTADSSVTGGTFSSVTLAGASRVFFDWANQTTITGSLTINGTSSGLVYFTGQQRKHGSFLAA